MPTGFECSRLKTAFVVSTRGAFKRGAFTWDLIVEDWCFLDNGGPRVVPKSKRTKQSVEEG